MKTKEEARELCRQKGKEIEKWLEDGGDLLDFFEGGVSRLLFKVEREDGVERLVGGEAEGGGSRGARTLPGDRAPRDPHSSEGKRIGGGRKVAVG